MDDRPIAGVTSAQVAVIGAALLQVLTPLLPQLGIGEPIGSRSNTVRTLITPAGWAFAIWGALYTGAALFAIYQALPTQRRNPLLARIRWPAAGAFLGNALWAAYTQSFGLAAPSVVIIAATLGCLLLIYRRFAATRLSVGERWFVYLPLSALSSWLTVATIVNIAATLRFYGIDGGAMAAVVGAGVLVIGGAIACLALIRGHGNLPYAAVFLWALSAIYLAGGQRAGAIAAGVVIAGVLVATGAILGIRRAR